jgi:hypothetical protein
MIEKYLMSFDDYNKVDHPMPYTYTHQKDNQFLYYFGANHSHDPANKQYDELRYFWHDFLNRTNKINSIVLVEGGERPICSSEDEAISKGAEAHFITFLAAKESVPTFSPEPPEKFRFNELLKKFSKEEIIYYEFVRMVYQWNRHHGVKPDFDQYLGNTLKHAKNDSGWDDFDFSIKHMVEIEQKLFGRDFNKNDQEFYYDVINPTTTLSRINELSRFEDSGFRDGYILKQIEQYWNEGKNIFVVYGCSHAVMHEPAIKELA